MQMQVSSYQLPGGLDVPPQSVRDKYRTGGFDPEVRNWHLERLPRLTVDATFIICPWCGKKKDSRSMQIDHIIPIRQYVRFKLYQARVDVGGADSTSSSKRLTALRAANSDTKNLLLCCVKCNSGSQDTMPTAKGLSDAITRVGVCDLANRLEALKKVLEEIAALPTDSHNVDVKDWVLNGSSAPTSQITTRARKSAAPYPDAEEKLRGVIARIENLVIDQFSQSRPAFTVTADQLQALQTTEAVKDVDLRLCYYCLGLFKKQAFQIDHINPASRRASTISAYNEPGNLIPVCRTCNTSKGDRSLSQTWLNEQIDERTKAGLPGVESAKGVAAPTGFVDYRQWVQQVRRIAVLGM